MLDDGKSGGITVVEASSWSLNRVGECGEEKE